MGTNQKQVEIPEELRQRCEVWTRVMGYHRPVTLTSMGEVYEEDLGYLRFTGVSPQGEEEIDIKDL
ncbi:MAG: hypothetical protein RBQ99_01665 [Trichlorobacter sp.]|nr:hypothetical protein [Trichlorobacter sp.]